MGRPIPQTELRLEAVRGEEPPVGHLARASGRRRGRGAGRPRSGARQRIVACVQPAAAADVSEAELLSFMRGRISAYKNPEWIFVESRLPTTSVGKLDRARLARTVAERVAVSGEVGSRA